MVISTFAIALCPTNNSTPNERNEKNKNKQSAVHAAETKTIQLNVGFFLSSLVSSFVCLNMRTESSEKKNARWKFICRVRRRISSGHHHRQRIGRLRSRYYDVCIIKSMNACDSLSTFDRAFQTEWKCFCVKHRAETCFHRGPHSLCIGSTFFSPMPFHFIIVWTMSRM